MYVFQASPGRCQSICGAFSMASHSTLVSLALSVFPIIFIASGRSIEEVMAKGCSHDDSRNAVGLAREAVVQ